MPPAGTAESFAPSATNYAPTGAIEVAQIALPLPPEMMLTGANTNDLNSVVWGVWMDIYTNTIHVTQSTTSASTIDMPSVAAAANSAIWGAWNAQIASRISAAIASNIGQPINAATSAAITNTITADVWGAWNLTVQNLRDASAEQVRRVQEQARLQREQATRAQADRSRVEVERTLAEKRAEKLLQGSLSAAQREELASKGFFTLRTIAKSGEERIYRIRRGRSRNVEQVDAQGNRLKTLCAHPADMIPDADTMLAQKLMLETPDTQEEFLRIANHS